MYGGNNNNLEMFMWFAIFGMLIFILLVLVGVPYGIYWLVTNLDLVWVK